MSSETPETPAPAAPPWYHDAEQLARRVLESTSDGIAVYDRDLRYRFWNHAMAERTGVTAEDLYGRVCFEIFPHIRDEGLIAYLERALEGERVQSPDYHYLSPFNGAEGWATTRFEPYRDDTGAIIGVIAQSRDTTARRRAAETMERNESQFRTIIESASEIVSILDRSGIMRYASPALSPTVGWAPEEAIGRNPIDRVHPDDRSRVLEAFRETLRLPGKTHRVQYRSQHSNGSWRTLLSSTRNLLDDPSVNGIVVTSRDVTDWVELQVRLQQSQRIEAVGRLAGGVAHDFNNLLTVISGNAQALLAARQLPEALREEMDEIAQAADRAATLTRQLLAFSRQQVLQPRVLDLNEVLRGIWTLVQHLVGESVVLELRAAESLGAVTADPVQVEQVLINLAVNARDAMPDGGRLVIETAVVTADARFARQHEPMPAGEYIRLQVRDSGSGMDETTRARVFDPFFTTKALGHGTGMGLPTVYGIVKQSGGYIWIESALGTGTTITIYLPQSAPAERVTPPPLSARELRRGSETILVAEDEELVRAMARRTLERAGYRVLEASNGVEALAAAATLGEELDLLLTDIVMPEMGGRELAATLRRERPSLRILFMSGYTQERESHLSAGEGISHFLHKPFTLHELRERVRLLLDETAALA
ncbi:MAG: PAS domain S-box protein [Gemmatimonadota bacterium]